MKWNKVILLSLLLALVASLGVFQETHAAKESKITIVNHTRSTIYFILDGPEHYEIKIEGGTREDQTVLEGLYDYEYTACGDTIDATLDIDDDIKIVIYTCGEVPSKMQVKNHLGKDIDLKLYGPKDYDLDIEPGKSQVQLLSGDYVYTYEACDNTEFSGEFNVTKNGKTVLYLRSCEWHDDPVRNFGKPNPVKFRIVNYASFPIDMYLIGPATYYVTVSPGVNRYIVLSGTYEFSYYVDFTLQSGVAGVKQNGLSILVISPSRVTGTEDLEVE